MSQKTGKIKKYLDDKGFGFIESGKFDTFFHINDCENIDQAQLQPGVEVSFEISKDQNGRVKAINLQLV